MPSKKVPVVVPRALSSAQREAATRQLEQKFEGSDALTYGRSVVQASARLNVQTLGVSEDDPRYIQRPGRVLADGSRRGARVLRKLTVHLPAARGIALDEHTHVTRETISDTIDRALAAIGIGVEAKPARAAAPKKKPAPKAHAAKKKAAPAKKKGRAA